MVCLCLLNATFQTTLQRDGVSNVTCPAKLVRDEEKDTAILKKTLDKRSTTDTLEAQTHI